MKKNPFGYAESEKDEVGIYIVCEDAALLLAINKMLKKHGIISIGDTAGRHHYIIDARKTPGRATDCLYDLIFSEKSGLYQDDEFEDVMVLEQAIDRVLVRNRFDRTLMGTKLIVHLLKYIYKSGGIKSIKLLNSRVGRMYGMTNAQVERNVRYSLQKSDMWRDGLKNGYAYMELYEQLKRAVKRRKRVLAKQNQQMELEAEKSPLRDLLCERSEK